MKLLYLHGYNSSGNTAELLKTEYPDLIVPNLDFHDPFATMSILLELVDNLNKDDDVYIIASSLGGFFAEFISNMRIVHIIQYNPSLIPDVSLRKYGEFSEECLRKYEYEKQYYKFHKYSSSTKNVVLSTDDEVIDYRIAAEYYRDYPVVLTNGGHRMTYKNAAIINDILNSVINQF